MIIALFNVRIDIYKNELVTDDIGNHKNGWKYYHSCFATVGGESADEIDEAGHIVESTDVDFTVRYCSEVKDIDSTHYQIKFRNNTYNIVGVDHMNFKLKAIKFHCKKVTNNG